ncbi:MAG TPA: MarR family transcriptional regulator [Actinophytocola sp.]|jgi:DNA-binding MarR family transcriptional regulator|uniref:MarR family winged helix-turn-helix transcriptional regulator n=1 Tax=Actinophytocola sp. TaxID=1872138 RepID=UPI002DFC0038|nr:MarR family transcriptional regulator [Actinophytocola sp.]
MNTRVPIGLVLGGGSLLSKVSRELTTAVERELAPLGVTAQQAALILYAAPAASRPNELAAEVGTDTAGMTRLLDRLESKGLLTRGPHPKDRRAVVVELTPDGHALVPQIAPCFGRVTTRLLDGFNAPEIKQLNGLLNRMLENLR